MYMYVYIYIKYTLYIYEESYIKMKEDYCAL